MKRLFEDGNYTDVSSLVMNEANVMFMDLLHALEARVGEPVDLRDFHYLVSSTIGAFVCDLSLGRRMSGPDTQPRELMRHYPRLNVMPMIREDDRREPAFPWQCDESPNGSCEYDEANDTMHDSCIHCGSPHERK